MEIWWSLGWIIIITALASEPVQVFTEQTFQPSIGSPISDFCEVHANKAVTKLSNPSKIITHCTVYRASYITNCPIDNCTLASRGSRCLNYSPLRVKVMEVRGAQTASPCLSYHEQIEPSVWEVGRWARGQPELKSDFLWSQIKQNTSAEQQWGHVHMTCMYLMRLGVPERVFPLWL